MTQHISAPTATLEGPELMKHCDLLVISSGPAGEKAAVHAAYHGFKVAVIERRFALGGAGVNTGALPSKTLKETALYLSGGQGKGLYSVERKLSRQPEAADFLFRERYVVKSEGEELRLELLRRKVDVYFGVGRFLDPHRIGVTGQQAHVLYGEKILIATGSCPAHPSGIPFDAKCVRIVPMAGWTCPLSPASWHTAKWTISSCSCSREERTGR